MLTVIVGWDLEAGNKFADEDALKYFGKYKTYDEVIHTLEKEYLLLNRGRNNDDEQDSKRKKSSPNEDNNRANKNKKPVHNYAMTTNGDLSS